MDQFISHEMPQHWTRNSHGDATEVDSGLWLSRSYTTCESGLGVPAVPVVPPPLAPVPRMLGMLGRVFYIFFEASSTGPTS